MIQPQILLSALPVFVFSWRVRSVWGAVLLGMGVYWGLGFVF
jgi:branched-subunit amino acid transport protein